MSDFYINDSEYCLADDYFYSSVEKIFDFKNDDIGFNQCFLGDEVRNKEIAKALNEVEAEKQFAFYDLGLTARDQQLLTSIGITKFNNEVIVWPKIDNSEILDTLRPMFNLSKGEIGALARVITRITADIVNLVEADEAEVVIRTREAHESDGCSYWHIDKNRNQSLKDLDSAELEIKEYGSNVFLVVLIGESTDYQKVEHQQRELFKKYANETIFYYGHDAIECRKDDEITNLFKEENNISVKRGYGSVHKTGNEGTIHKEPNKSVLGRIILIITPIYKTK